MDFKGIVDKAKNWAQQNPDKADSYVDKATDAVGNRFGHAEQVDGVGDRAKDFLHGGGEPDRPGPDQQGAPGPDQPRP